MIYIEAPDNHYGSGLSVFLAGTITGAPDWQQEAVRLLESENVVLLNPRRADFPIGDPKAAPLQIEWEHIHLRKADAILFWFSKETLAPIVLYELGAWSMMGKPIFVGVHPDYPRRQDVLIQTRLARPEVRIVSDLSDLTDQVREWIRSREVLPVKEGEKCWSCGKTPADSSCPECVFGYEPSVCSCGVVRS